MTMDTPELAAPAELDDASARRAPSAWWLLALVGLALALDLVFYTGLYCGDDRIYLDSARQVMEGTKLSFSHFGATRFGIVLPLALLFKVFGYELFAAGVLFALYHAGLVVLTWNLGRLLHDRVTGLFAAGLVAIWPTIVNESTMILPDTLMACFIVGAITLLVATTKAERAGASRRALVLAGLASFVLMLGFTVKIAVIMYLPAFGLWLALSAPKIISKRTAQFAAASAIGVVAGYGLDQVLTAIFASGADLGGKIGQVSGFSQEYATIAATRDAYLPWDRIVFILTRLKGEYGADFWWPVVVGVLAYPFLKGRSWLLLMLLAWAFLFRTIGSVSLTSYAPPTLQVRYYTAMLVIALVMLGYLASFALTRAEALPKPHGRRVAVALVVALILFQVRLAWRTTEIVDRAATSFGYAEIGIGARRAIDQVIGEGRGGTIVLSPALYHRIYPLLGRYEGDVQILRANDAAIDWAAGRPGRFWYLSGKGIDQLEAEQWTPVDRVLQRDPTAPLQTHEVFGRRFVQQHVGYFSPVQSRLAFLRGAVFGGSITSDVHWPTTGVYLSRVEIERAIVGPIEGDFERWRDGAPEAWSSSGAVARSEDRPNLGGACVELGPGAARLEQTFAAPDAPPGATMRLDGAVRVGEGCTLTATVRDAAGAIVAEATVAESTGDWRRLALAWPIDAAADPYTLDLEHAGDAASFVDALTARVVAPDAPMLDNADFESAGDGGALEAWIASYPEFVGPSGASFDGARAMVIPGGLRHDVYAYQTIVLDESAAGADVTLAVEAWSADAATTVVILQIQHEDAWLLLEAVHPGDGHWRRIVLSRQLPMNWTGGEVRAVLKKRPRSGDGDSRFDAVRLFVGE